MKVTALILFILIISSSLFYYGCFDIMLLRSKNMAMNSIANAEHNHSLTLFKVPVSQQAAYSDDEIRIEGNLYDVSERKISNDTLYLSLYHDIDEQSILTAIGDFFKADDTAMSPFPNSSSLKNVRIIYNPQYYFDNLQFSLQPVVNKNKKTLDHTPILSLAFYDILTPPPRLS